MLLVLGKVYKNSCLMLRGDTAFSAEFIGGERKVLSDI